METLKRAQELRPDRRAAGEGVERKTYRCRRPGPSPRPGSRLLKPDSRLFVSQKPSTDNGINRQICNLIQSVCGALVVYWGAHDLDPSSTLNTVTNIAHA